MNSSRRAFATLLSALPILVTAALLGPLTFSGRANPSADAATPVIKVLPPATGVYHAAYPDFGGSEDEVGNGSAVSAFETLTGKDIAWAYFSQNWYDGIVFPASSVQAIRAKGAVPFIRMMPRSGYDSCPEPTFTLQKIRDGAFDTELAQWARAARDSGGALMVEFGTEVNGDWFCWNGRWNGREAGGPTFVAAYRHIVDIFRAQGANNVTWVFHVDAQPWPERSWNKMADYYPGDNYVDWVGISAYGPQEPGEGWAEFTDVLDAGYAELAALTTKPMALLEFGITDGIAGHSKAAWVANALDAIRSGRYPRLKAISWWHENFRNDNGTSTRLRLDSPQGAADAYRARVTGDPFYVGAAVISTSGGTSPTATPTRTATATPRTATPSATATATRTSSPNATATRTATLPPAATATATPTSSRTTRGR